MTFSLRRIIAGIGANVFNRLSLTIVQLALVPVLSVHWGLPVYGAWLLLATIPTFLGMSDLGFATAAGTRMTMLSARGERGEAQIVFQSAWAMILATTAIAAAVALAAIWLIPGSIFPTAGGFSAEDARATLEILVIYGILALVGNIIPNGFRAAEQYHWGATLATLAIIFENGAVIVAVFLGAEPLGAAMALLAARVAGIFLQYEVFRRRVDWLHFGLKHASAREVRNLLGPAMALISLPLGQAALLQGVSLALGAAAGPAAVPALNATRTLSRVGILAGQMFSHAISPELSAVAGRRDESGRAILLAANMLAALLIAVPFAIVLIIFGQDIVRLWSRGIIIPPLSLMAGIALSVVLGGLWNPLATMAVALNRLRVVSLEILAVSALTLIPAYLLSLQFGASGAALATALADGGILALFIWRFREIFGPPSLIRDAVPVILKQLRSILSGKGRV